MVEQSDQIYISPQQRDQTWNKNAILNDESSDWSLSSDELSDDDCEYSVNEVKVLDAQDSRLLMDPSPERQSRVAGYQNSFQKENDKIVNNSEMIL